MTCDGKVMVVTEREMGAIEVATGGEADETINHKWTLGVAWLAMTYATACRWCNGREHAPHPVAEVEEFLAIERARWYA